MPTFQRGDRVVLKNDKKMGLVANVLEDGMYNVILQSGESSKLHEKSIDLVQATPPVKVAIRPGDAALHCFWCGNKHSRGSKCFCDAFCSIRACMNCGFSVEDIIPLTQKHHVMLRPLPEWQKGGLLQRALTLAALDGVQMAMTSLPWEPWSCGVVMTWPYRVGTVARILLWPDAYATRAESTWQALSMMYKLATQVLCNVVKTSSNHRIEMFAVNGDGELELCYGQRLSRENESMEEKTCSSETTRLHKYIATATKPLSFATIECTNSSIFSFEEARLLISGNYGMTRLTNSRTFIEDVALPSYDTRELGSMLCKAFGYIVDMTSCLDAFDCSICTDAWKITAILHRAQRGGHVLFFARTAENKEAFKVLQCMLVGPNSHNNEQRATVRGFQSVCDYIIVCRNTVVANHHSPFDSMHMVARQVAQIMNSTSCKREIQSLRVEAPHVA